VESIAELRESLEAFVKTKPTEWKPSVSMNFSAVTAEKNAVSLSFMCSHLALYVEVGKWKKSKTDLLVRLREEMIRLGIQWVNPPHCVEIVHFQQSIRMGGMGGN